MKAALHSHGLFNTEVNYSERITDTITGAASPDGAGIRILQNLVNNSPFLHNVLTKNWDWCHNNFEVVQLLLWLVSSV